MTTTAEQRHPFVIGQQYRNELGEYTVIELDWPNMVIQFTDGNRITSPVILQFRIWERLQEEKQMLKMRAADKSSGSKSTRNKSRSRYGRNFHGLSDSDFGPSLAGTSWRRKEELGGLLAVYTSERTEELYDSSPVARRAAVHIVQPQFYRAKEKQRTAKFLFELSPEDAFYGFYIEKNNKPMDESWDWPRFINAFGSDTQLQAGATVAMEKLGLDWFYKLEDDEGTGKRYVVAEEGVLQLQSDGETKNVDWDDFTGNLNAIPEKLSCHLFLGKRIDKAQAIEMGVGIANEAATVFAALAPLYTSSINQSAEVA